MKSINETLISTILIAIILSICSYFLVYSLNLSTAYNDAMSHLNLARLVIDNIQPGFAQLGGDWLPLNHVLMLLFIWNNWAWHSGFAGTFYSMVGYVTSVVFVYLSVRLLTKNNLTSLVGSLAYAFNLNILYLQSTPLTESFYLMLFILSAYFFIRWMLKNRLEDFILLGFFTFLQILTRYDGWFVFGFTGLLIIIRTYLLKRENINKILGRAMIYALPGLFGIIMWLIWNQLIFNDPFYFAFGPFSAHSQQSTIQSRAGLITKYDINLSILAYLFAAIDNVGVYLVVISGIGALLYIFMKQTRASLTQRILIILFLISPIFFHIISLFVGFSVINLPELHWNPSSDPSSSWFNVRYGITALPFVAIIMGLISNIKRPFLIMILLAVIVIQQFITYRTGIITVLDGTIGSSSFANQDIAMILKNNVKNGDKVVMANSFFNAVAFQSSFDLKQFIHEGVSEEWANTIVYPDNYAPWIVMANGDIGEPIYTSLIKKQGSVFLKTYKLFYIGKHANIYHLRNTDELFIGKYNDKLLLGHNIFTLKGVNSYDLVYKSDEEIKSSLKILKDNGITTVRFWLFGDGIDNGFQPKAGIVNEDRLKQVDLIFSVAHQYGIKLIPVLVNNWSDYGGKGQYLRWIGKDSNNSDAFYTDKNAINLFKNYINIVLSRTNTITKTKYVEEPVVLTWEIINEPRAIDDKNQILEKWIDDIATYIRTIDNNHLISVGTERVSSSQDSETNNRICALETIDICSIHLYLEKENQPVFNKLNDVNDFLILQHQSTTNKKPILVEEIGIPKDFKPFGENNLEIFRKIISRIGNDGYNGVLIWNWAMNNDISYGFSPNGDVNKQYDIAGLNKILSDYNFK